MIPAKPTYNAVQFNAKFCENLSFRVDHNRLPGGTPPPPPPSARYDIEIEIRLERISISQPGPAGGQN